MKNRCSISLVMLVPPTNPYRDVIPAAIAWRMAPNDTLLEAAWRRSGQGFPGYPQTPEHQGIYSAWYGEAGKFIGLIEHGGMPPL